MKISMTTFVDFVIARGNTRITRIREAKDLYGEEYSPARDYYRRLREAIIAVHYEGKDLATLDAVIKQANLRKRELYGRCVSGYKRWRGHKNLSSYDVHSAPWQDGQLEVRINPELGLTVDGDNYVIKLYFKGEQPTKRQLDVILHLLNNHPVTREKGAAPAVLDMQRGKLFIPTRQIDGIDALLTGEAAAFVAMWNHI